MNWFIPLFIWTSLVFQYCNSYFYITTLFYLHESPLVRVQLKRDGTRWRTGGKWRGYWRMECLSSTLHTTTEHGVSSITTVDAHTSAASSRLNWRPSRFKWTRPFRRKTKSGFCACAITFQTQSDTITWRVILKGNTEEFVRIDWNVFEGFNICLKWLSKTRL